LLDPPVQREIGRGRGGRQQERDRLREVADRVVALAEEPVRNAGLLNGPRREFARFEETLGTASEEEARGPRGVCRRGGGEVASERGDLLVGLGGGVERGVEVGEELHDS